MRRLGLWLRGRPGSLYWLVLALLLFNILVVLLGSQPPTLALSVATVLLILVLTYAWRRGRSQ